MNRQEKVFDLIRTERGRQDKKWGSQRDLAFGAWHLILSEEVGEVAKAVLEGKRTEMRTELIQVAAVAVCWLEALGAGLDD